MKKSHILADGTKLNSIEGHLIPGGHPVYEIFNRCCKSAAERQAVEVEEKSVNNPKEQAV